MSYLPSNLVPSDHSLWCLCGKCPVRDFYQHGRELRTTQNYCSFRSACSQSTAGDRWITPPQCHRALGRICVGFVVCKTIPRIHTLLKCWHSEGELLAFGCGSGNEARDSSSGLDTAQQTTRPVGFRQVLSPARENMGSRGSTREKGEKSSGHPSVRRSCDH